MPTSTPRTTASTTDPTSPAPTGARPGNGAARRPGTTGSGGGSGSPRTAGSGGAGTGPGRGSARPASTGPGPGATRPGRRHDRRRPPTAVHRGSGPHHWFAERLLAVLSGRRPVHSLIGHTIGPAYDQLITLAPADPPHEPAYDARRLSPVLHGCGRFTPGPGVIEAFARIATGDRLTALAFRLEQGPDLRWRCAAVELHGPRP
ncbi:MULTISPECIES: Rv3235 family protein [unclassified Streptomyces]|uniref:Rv3235 family protein n=1 Tax=unclassified Streptomyces TaxID=2593676 RepID=UPI00202F7A7C|nr:MULTISPECIES: Rv3235 family protein [unclassified Streptomyces]MCM1975415.1 Rv3235 family protein [Streptomyces sp. G1]MCX5126083.1 Rv3235 family protein [Streptomyces sp. NBC_00347]MCX5298118.1 Rv3235 family protein [Streptomyces sp. NBC_00193]